MRASGLFLCFVTACGDASVGTDEGVDDTGAVTGTTNPFTTPTPPYDPGGPNLATTGTSERCLVTFGGNDRVRASNDEDPPLPFGTQPRTMQAWVRTDKLIDQVAMSYGRASPGQGFQLTTEDGFPAVRTGWSSTQVVTGSQFIADDQWHHLAASWDGQLAVLMVDGVLVGIGDLPGDTLEGDIVAGNTPTGDLSKSWIGWIDDVKVLKGTRLPEEVLGDLDAETVNPSDVTLHWDFEVPEGSEGPGVPNPDLSGNGHDGLSAGLDTPQFPPCR